MADLTTKANVKAWLQITDTSLDTLLDRLITATSQDFLNEINRPDLMPAADYSERIILPNVYPARCLFTDFWSSQSLWLRHYPVNTVASVMIDDTALDQIDSITDRGWWFDSTQTPENRQQVHLIGWDLGLSFGSPWPQSQAWGSAWMPQIIVNYNGGYNTVPPAIEQAIIEWVSFKRGQSQLQQLDQSAGGERIGDYELVGQAIDNTMTSLDAEIPATVQRVIDQYRRPVI